MKYQIQTIRHITSIQKKKLFHVSIYKNFTNTLINAVGGEKT